MSDDTVIRLRPSLGDRYRIARELGCGGMSHLLLALPGHLVKRRNQSRGEY